MNSLIEFNLDDLINAAEAAGWEVEVITKHFPGREETVINNEGELEPLYIPAYCNIKLSINTG